MRVKPSSLSRFRETNERIDCTGCPLSGDTNGCAERDVPVSLYIGMCRNRLEDCAVYLIRLMTLNIGRYNAMIIPPITTPMITIRIGSINDVRASTVASTS